MLSFKDKINEAIIKASMKRKLCKSAEEIFIKSCNAILNNLPGEIDVKGIKDFHLEKDILDFKKMCEEAPKKVSAKEFSKNHFRIPFVQRVKLASQIYDLGESNFEVLAYSHPEELLKNTEKIGMLKWSGDKVKSVLGHLMEAAKEPAKILKIACLYEKYTGNLDLRDFFKEAEEEKPKPEMTIELGNNIYNLSEVSKEACIKALGEDLTKKMFDKEGKISYDILKSLPKPDKDLIDKYLSIGAKNAN